MRTEPALIAGAVVALLNIAVTFGVDISDASRAAISTAIIAVGALFTRSKVTPVG